jgi:Cdc6-like AAA superfamily ATPase
VSPANAPLRQLGVTQPGILRYLLDRYAPRLHYLLTELGTLSRPSELDDLRLYLRNLHSDTEHEIRHKTYIPITGREVPPSTLAEDNGKDLFIKPIHQIIRQLVGISHGGDSASAQIAAMNRKSRIVRNILTELFRADEPLVLLGDPGTGKTMTLKQTVMALAARESRRVFPIIILYVRLGEFRVEGKVGSSEVTEYVHRSAPETIGPYLNDLKRVAHRLVILFDSMDEMSRERYTEHTEALSRFAGECKGVTKTLFSCRITDFSPKFIHRRLVLLPFNRAQIIEYLGKYIDSFPLTIDGENWTLKRLAKQLTAGSLPIEANNPFVLWLLCIYLQEKKTWPSSRVEMLEFFNNLNYRRKAEEVREGESAFPAPEVTFAGWGRCAYTITALNQGAAVTPDALKADFPEDEDHIEELIHIGKRCGILVEVINGDQHLVRFEHHRFQEYFTALHIQQECPRIFWLDKLDAPRWQETMLNLFLMGGADDAIEALAAAIVEPIRHHEAERLRRQQIDAPNGATAASNHPSAAYVKEDILSGTEAPAASDLLDQGKRFDNEEGNGDVVDEGVGRDGVVIVGDGGGSWWSFTDEQETVTADRVELASRILRQVGTRASTMRATLLPSFNEAVNLLSTIGNPITQVKMLQVCQSVPELDFIELLQQSLWSPINWVRDQALVVLAKGERSTRAAGYNFATEMAFDLVYGRLLVRLPGYIKAALASPSKRPWRCIMSGALCSLLNLLLQLSVGALIFSLVALVFPDSRVGIQLADPRGVATYVAIVLIAAVVALKYAPHQLGIAILASSAGSMLLHSWMTHDLDNRYIDPYVIIMGLLPVAAFVAFLVGGLINSASHSLTLFLFLALNPQTTASGYSAKSFLGSWQDVKDLFGRSTLYRFTKRATYFICIPLLYLLISYTARPLSVWLNKTTNLPLHPYITLYLVVATAIAIVTLVLSLARLKIKLYAEISRLVLAVIVGLGPCVGAIFILNRFVRYLDGILSRWFGVDVGTFVTKAIFILIMLAIVVTMAYSLYRLVRRVMRSARRNMRPFAPGSMTPSSWRKQLAESKPDQQHILLLRTNYQSLGIKADDYFEFLKEVRPLITSEPALSTYWSQRAQIEQVLKQERVG